MVTRWAQIPVINGVCNPYTWHYKWVTGVKKKPTKKKGPHKVSHKGRLETLESLGKKGRTFFLQKTMLRIDFCSNSNPLDKWMNEIT